MRYGLTSEKLKLGENHRRVVSVRLRSAAAMRRKSETETAPASSAQKARQRFLRKLDEQLSQLHAGRQKPPRPCSVTGNT